MGYSGDRLSLDKPFADLEAVYWLLTGAARATGALLYSNLTQLADGEIKQQLELSYQSAYQDIQRVMNYPVQELLH